MQRTIYILLLPLLYCFFGIINYANESAQEKHTSYQLQQIVSESNTTDEDMMRTYDNKMLRSASVRCIMAEECSSVSSPTSSARYRTTTTLKIMASAVSARHAGHVTRIFEFNHFKSSLRIVYYLYALCRLRI